jgi:predicted amidohydrolase YtcJ
LKETASNPLIRGTNNLKKRSTNVIDLKSKTVYPGFIDMHVHIEGEYSPDRYLKVFQNNPEDTAFEAAEIANRTLMAGFTTVRDMGGTGVNIALRNAINKGLVSWDQEFLLRVKLSVQQVVTQTLPTVLKILLKEIQDRKRE